MNDYFVHHAVQKLDKQLKTANIVTSNWSSKDMVSLAIQLATMEQLEAVSSGIIDVETELEKIRKQLGG